MQPPGLLAHALEPGKILRARTHEEPLIEEGRGCAENNVPVSIVLILAKRLIAEANGSHAAVSRQLGDHLLLEARFKPDTIDRLDAAVFRAGHDVHHPSEVKLHRSDRGERVERANDEKRVPDPAEAIVPIAPRAGSLGDARRHGRDDGACRLVAAELECDGGPDHCLLPLERQRQPVHPRLPVVERALLERSRCFGDARLECFVGPEDQVDRCIEDERCLPGDVISGSIGGESQREVGGNEAKVVRPLHERAAFASVIVARSHVYADAWAAAQRTNSPDEHLRSERPFPPFEARCEIRDLDRALGTLEHSPQNRRVRQIALPRRG